ncbi:PAP1-domain-containing protein [Xylariomycetidae sp. FL2044]|nr:PAP1-domain-containing protein [Xylariomycetidae sp. FL2044]
MASTQQNVLSDFILTPQQQSLLFRALTSNQPGGNGVSNNPPLSSPNSQSKHDGNNASASAEESPFLDYDYDLGPDGSFDFDFSNDGQAKMIGDLPGSTASPIDDNSTKASSPENDNSDKRSHPEDDDDDDDEPGSSKRRESDGRAPKKPGRKPLTNEPSSKRKAQNRAAQRAFRERKEKHLKDLETKVEELEKASAATNNENSQLRSRIDKMTVELNEYKKKVTIMNNGSRSVSGSGRSSQHFASNLMPNLNEVNFQFEFPKFGVLPGPGDASGNGTRKATSYPTPSGGSPNGQASPLEKPKDQATPNTNKSRENSESHSQSKDAAAKFSGVFTGSAPYENAYGNMSRTSLDSAQNSVNGGNTGSPSSSTHSNMGPSSSCGTSPEPFTQSPLGFKPVDTLTTIGEEQPAVTSNTNNQWPNLDNVELSIDWLSAQNNGQFDPQLFGDYREPQDNILANTTFDDSFFNDAFDVDFTMPYNMAPSPNPPKKDLIAEIDARKETEDTITASPNGKLMTCNNIWEKLQTCPKVQAGDLDLDGLCSDLQKKAKCGGTGAVVDEQDFKAVMTKYLGNNCQDIQ